MKRTFTVLAVVGVCVWLVGCASTDTAQLLPQTRKDLTGLGVETLALTIDPALKAQNQQLVHQLLGQPLQQRDALRLTLANSAALQALLAQATSDTAAAAQLGRIANPRLGMEWSTLADEWDLARRISFGLLEVLTLSPRQAIAQREVERVQLQLSMDVVAQVSVLYQAWVRAVAAQQAVQYAQQVQDAASAGAELARRMQAVGNISKLQAARQQLWYGEVTAQLALAKDEALAQREALVRALGLDSAQAKRLQLPDQLPELPAVPRSIEDVQATGLQTRLDLRLARAAWEGAARASQLGQINTRSDLDITLQSDIVRDSSGSALRNGVGLEVTLPLFDDGSLRRTTLDARALALANQLQATERVAASQLRESYAHYRSNYELARHYRDEMVPLRKTMADETLLRYNGMLIGVFDLLNDAQEQATVVRAALVAQQQFWLADAALQASLMGRPLLAGSGLNLPLSKGSSDAAH